jgi:hypothetical protein
MNPYVTSTLIGIIPFADQKIEDELGNAITVNTDFNKLARTGASPKVGPLEIIDAGANTVSIGVNITPTAGIKYIAPASIPPSTMLPVISNKLELKTYPNPFTNKISLINAIGEENFLLIDSAGRLIWQGSNIEQEEFSTLKSDFYYLKVKVQNSAQTLKLLKL